MNKPVPIEYVATDKAKYKGEVTEAQVAAWKAANPKGIFRVFSDDDTHVGYFRNPLRGDVNYALSQADNKKPLASVEAFGEMLWLGGSEDILRDDALWLGVVEQLRVKMNGVKARLENL